MYGARLVALLKTDGGLRPIACGDVFRRMAAKLLCAAVADDARAHLKECGQLGVCVPGGMDAISHAARRYAQDFLQPGSDRVIFKADFRNAFNCCARSEFLQAVRDQFPALYEYSVAAYGEDTLLLFAGTFLASRAGVQQGDPLGPLFFSLALSRLLQNVEMDGLELNAWYLDDGTVGGRTMTVRRFVDSLRQVSAEHGLQLNMSKCELVCADSEIDRMRLLWPDLETVVPVSKFFLLGTPLGSDEEAQAHLRKVAEKSIRRANLITRLGDPVVASALLRYTTGFCIGNFYARSVGGLGRTVFSTIDEATLNAWETINFPFETPELRALACLPTSFGGIGLRELRAHCGVAFVASAVAAADLFPVLLKEHVRVLLASAPDAWLVSPAVDPVLSKFPSVVASTTR
jgi:hypothetical protein